MQVMHHCSNFLPLKLVILSHEAFPYACNGNCGCVLEDDESAPGSGRRKPRLLDFDSQPPLGMPGNCSDRGVMAKWWGFHFACISREHRSLWMTSYLDQYMALVGPLNHSPSVL